MSLVVRITAAVCVALCVALFGASPLLARMEVPARGPALPGGLSASDQAGIRAAHATAAYAATRVEDGHRARNAGQRWSTLFDGRGFTTIPDDADWSWGLDLVHYGWGRERTALSAPRAVTSSGGRVCYVWDARLTEWYVNDQRGLEHGYTVHARAPDAAGRLELRLETRGGLEPVASADGRDVRFLDARGAVALTYSGLTVLDADQRALAAGFECRDGALRLWVDDEDARYPLTIDPIAQQAYLKASNTGMWDAFGLSVAICGDTVVVGAKWEDSDATGVNGDGANDSATVSGAAYVFVRSGASWTQQAYLKASNTDAGDLFGWSVAISGDTIVVGAPSEDSNAKGIDGDASNNSAATSGAAYVFVRNGSTWSQQAYLKASNTGGAGFFSTGDRFGTSVAISGDTIVVGAAGESSSATGVNGPDNNQATSSGAAYVFVRAGATWSQQAYLKASNTGTGDEFGWAVSIRDDTIVVGAPYEDSTATGVDGEGSSNSAPESGAAYVFARNGTTWSHQTYLKASNTGTQDRFGWSVAVAGDTAVVGAVHEASSVRRADGGQANDGAAASGAAYVFQRTGTLWSQQAFLKASHAGAGDTFGYSVSVSGDTILVGAPWEDSSATGVNGNQSDNATNGSGAAYLFVRDGALWTQQVYLKASNPGGGDIFGVSVSICGELVVVGAANEDSGATGVNGNQVDHSAVESGAAYILDVPCGTLTAYGAGCAGSGGLVPVLAAHGCAAGAGKLAIEVTRALGGSAAMLLLGTAPLSQPIGSSCTLLVGPLPIFVPGFVLGGTGAGNGSLELRVTLPASSPVATVYVQAAIADPAQPVGVALTNGVRIDVE